MSPRLTLNILLSFAQFERELSSERVRDKVAASRRKGKWTGGTVPLGYDAKDKKLVINKVEAETVRTIFKGYLEQKSLSKLIAELDREGIVTKRRDTDVPKYRGGIPFTYGPLAHVLKNRVYIGETGHGGPAVPQCSGSPRFCARLAETYRKTTATATTQCRSNPVSGRGLPKTGIFQILAGDYRLFRARSG